MGQPGLSIDEAVHTLISRGYHSLTARQVATILWPGARRDAKVEALAAAIASRLPTPATGRRTQPR